MPPKSRKSSASIPDAAPKNTRATPLQTLFQRKNWNKADAEATLAALMASIKDPNDDYDVALVQELFGTGDADVCTRLGAALSVRASLPLRPPAAATVDAAAKSAFAEPEVVIEPASAAQQNLPSIPLDDDAEGAVATAKSASEPHPQPAKRTLPRVLIDDEAEEATAEEVAAEEKEATLSEKLAEIGWDKEQYDSLLTDTTSQLAQGVIDESVVNKLLRVAPFEVRSILRTLLLTAKKTAALTPISKTTTPASKGTPPARTPLAGVGSVTPGSKKARIDERDALAIARCAAAVNATPKKANEVVLTVSDLIRNVELGKISTVSVIGELFCCFKKTHIDSHKSNANDENSQKPYVSDPKKKPYVNIAIIMILKDGEYWRISPELDKVEAHNLLDKALWGKRFAFQKLSLKTAPANKDNMVSWWQSERTTHIVGAFTQDTKVFDVDARTASDFDAPNSPAKRTRESSFYVGRPELNTRARRLLALVVSPPVDDHPDKKLMIKTAHGRVSMRLWKNAADQDVFTYDFTPGEWVIFFDAKFFYQGWSLASFGTFRVLDFEERQLPLYAPLVAKIREVPDDLEYVAPTTRAPITAATKPQTIPQAGMDDDLENYLSQCA